MFLSNSYREKQGPLEAVNYHAKAASMHINASEIKGMSALNPNEQRRAILLDGEPLEDVDKFKYLGPMFIANCQSTEAIRSRVNLVRSTFAKNPAFGRGGIHPCVQRAGSTRQWCVQFCLTVAIRGLREWPTKGYKRSTTASVTFIT